MICVICGKEIKPGEPVTLWVWKLAHQACVEKKKSENG